ncbi:alpha/beta fold hydrolase [Paractinoplanes ferrugineus]|uniref:Alpha/beta hydrolase n=1 Tax=Paractinoplanes ferrugineus TaxID=113564 RepID=A0A919MAN6_9ACTN|nr:alpha/beta fold hydrolase [Actinoplanes ferrugineus]GIE08883.1 alpha/beta hydrolase [Actinoplanes ferrugineus]
MTTVLLIHGHPFDHTLWDPQAAALRAAGHRVVVPDLRGYGHGPAAGDVTRLGDFATDLAAHLDAEGIDRAVVGGVSMGGQIAMEFYRRFPARVAGLILVDTSPVPDDEAGRAWRYEMAERLLTEGMTVYADEALEKMITPYHVLAKPDVAAHVTRMMLATPPHGAAAALRGRARRPDYRPTLASVRVPTLVLVGAEDVFTPVADAELIHELVPGSELVVIERAGHLPGLEQAERVNEVILKFLAD